MSEYNEPWRIEDSYLGRWFEIIGADGKVVADDGSAASEYDQAMTKEIARRIVACVNACAGLSTETLETFGTAIPHGIIFRLEEVNRECDELIARAEAAESELGVWKLRAKEAESRCKKKIAALERVRSITVDDFNEILFDDWEAEACIRLLTERMEGE